MTRKQSGGSLTAMIGNLGWPLLLGGGMCGIFLALLYQGPLHTPLMMRYFAGHPINLCTTVLFFIGLAALLLKFVDVRRQFVALGVVELPAAPADGQRVDQVGELLDYLASLPDYVRQSYLGRRFNDLLESVERKGSAAGLDDEIKYLADMDVAKQQDSYALVRIVIWAAPMLGFLGTVVGITDALGDLGNQFASNKEAANNLSQAMNGLLSGLYVAFDTTAQALLLSMVLMFIQFLSDRLEAQILGTVDSRASEEMVGRFQELGGGSDPHLASIQRMMEMVIRASETLVERQAAVWQQSLETAEDRWSKVLASSGAVLQKAIGQSLTQSLEAHAEATARLEQASAASLGEKLDRWQAVMGESARALHAQQAEALKQGAMLTEAVRATGDVIKLEQALNANLSTLAGAKHFEETVLSMAAAVNLLSVRLGQSDSGRVELSQPKAKGRAA